MSLNKSELLMLVRVWSFLSNIGVGNSLDPSETRFIILTNRFAVIASLISFISFFFLIVVYNTDLILSPDKLALISGFLFLTVFWTNKRKYYSLSKLLISWLPVLVLMSISIYEKMQRFNFITMQDFYSYRFLLMTAAIVPILIISSKDIKFLLINLFPSFIGVIFFEVIHRSLGVGINQMGFGYHDPNLHIFDFVVALSYFTLLGFLFNQRVVFENHESELFDQRIKLEEKNKELRHLNSFTNEQNHEILAQSDRLKETNEALVEAKDTIGKQKQLLEDHNKNLEDQVKVKTKDLSRVTEELVINNNELRQFSHTLSHNLKSPVATCQGLLNLIDRTDLNDSNKELFKYLEDSVSKMQDVFDDLNEMLELRNKLYTSIEDVDLQKEIDALHSNFYAELRKNKINFNYTFDGDKIIKTNAKRLNGILFQIINNAIKFRSNKREPEIDIIFRKNGEYYSIIIRDNGIGIDMEKYKNKLFYPYQRFNIESVGKGLGLYLVKLQAESLGGQVKISSAIDEFTEVEVLLKA